MAYSFGKTLNLPVDETIAKLREALMANHLGVVSEVDVAAIFKAKMNQDHAPYKLLGICAPPLAAKVLASEMTAGALLPCNAAVYDLGNGQTRVELLDPDTISKLSDNATIHEVAIEAGKRLHAALDAL